MPKVIPPTWDNPKWQFPRHYKPLTLESFDVFKRTKKGDRDLTKMYEAIGKCMTQWSMAENALAGIFSALVHPEHVFHNPSKNAAINALGILISPRTKAEVIGEAAHHALTGMTVLKKRVNNHLKCVQKASARRNEIAHGVVCHIKGYGFALVPHIENPRKINKNPKFEAGNFILDGSWKYKYRSRDIERYSERFTLLFYETFNLAVDVETELRSLIEKRKQSLARHIKATNLSGQPRD